MRSRIGEKRFTGLDMLNVHRDISVTSAKSKQEAQLPLRNRASAMLFFVAKLLSIAAMTYSYVYHRNLRPAN